MSSSSSSKFLDSLLSNRFQSTKKLQEVLSQAAQTHPRCRLPISRRRRQKQVHNDRLTTRSGGGTHYLTGTHKGNFFRVKVVPPPVVNNESRAINISLPEVPKLPPPLAGFRPLTPVPPPPSSSSTSSSSAHQQPIHHGVAYTSHSPSAAAASIVVSTNNATAAASALMAKSHYMVYLEDLPSRLWQWWKENWATLLLNFGSICTLTAFTRSDVLELRTFSTIGSLCGVVYQVAQTPRRLLPAAWSFTFASVNGWMIYNILKERTSSVRLSQEQQAVFVRHFMPHGVTPKQFETVYKHSKLVHYPAGTAIIRQGQEHTKVYLVVSGHTRANIMGRRLSAASVTTTPTTTAHDEQKMGGAASSGAAWIGEMSFLEKYWVEEQAKIKPAAAAATNVKAKPSRKATTAAQPLPPIQQSSTKTTTTTTEKTQSGVATAPSSPSPSSAAGAATAAPAAAAAAANDSSAPPPPPAVRLSTKKTVHVVDLPPAEARMTHALYTIVAVDDECTVLEWSHEDMTKLMALSTDMRAAMTRAMTAAIVGKVIHYTVSRQKNALPTWSTWLDDWKHRGDAATTKIQVKAKEVAEEEETTTVSESLPSYPVNTFAAAAAAAPPPTTKAAASPQADASAAT